MNNIRINEENINVILDDYTPHLNISIDGDQNQLLVNVRDTDLKVNIVTEGPKITNRIIVDEYNVNLNMYECKLPDVIDGGRLI